MITMTSPTIPTGQITAADLFAEVSATRREVAAALTQIQVMETRHAAINGDVTDHESRLRVLEGLVPIDLSRRLVSLERWQWKAAGAIAAVAIIFGALAGYLASLATHGH